MLAFIWLLLQCWFALSLVTFYQVQRRFTKRAQKDPQVYRAFERVDLKKRGPRFTFHLILNSIFLFPLRASLLILSLIPASIYLWFLADKCILKATKDNIHEIASNGKSRARDNNDTERLMEDNAHQQYYRNILRWVLRGHVSLTMRMAGLKEIREYKVHNNNFDFPPEESRDRLLIERIEPTVGKVATRPPKMYVSNHVSIFDIFVFIVQLFPTFVAKAAVLNLPVIGNYAKSLNCLFVNRSCADNREKTASMIAERHDEIWKVSTTDFLRANTGGASSKTREFAKYVPDALSTNPSYNYDTPSMVVFPEGTTSSGRNVLPLKRGAFAGLRPVSPVVLMYRCPYISCAYDIIPFIWLAPLILSTPPWGLLTIDMYWLREVLPPSPLTGPKASRVEAFSCEIRKRMSRVLIGEADQDWPVPDDVNAFPDAWTGSMTVKRELLDYLFQSLFFE